MKTLSYKEHAPRTFSHEAALAIKILSNRNRYTVMNIILRSKKDLCVRELSETAGISQSATSHLLSYLEACGAVRGIRTGKTTCYVSSRSTLTKKIARIIHILN